MKVKFKKLNVNAVLPVYSKPGDAGMDLTVTSVTFDDDSYIATLGFGLAMEIPEGYVGMLFPRSSVYKTGAILSNAVGIIDSCYRGEVMAKFYHVDKESMYKVGDRAIQMVIMPYPQIEAEWAEELSSTERGEGGYGSTGK